MSDFRVRLQQEFLRRSEKNPQYSLRAFARQLDIHHATLSTLLAGKRKVTKTTVTKLAPALGLSPREVNHFSSDGSSDQTRGQSLSKSSRSSEPHAQPYFLIQEQAFAYMSDWYFDAILEMSQIEGLKLTPAVVAQSLGISALRARTAIETLQQLGLIQIDKKGKGQLTHRNTTNILNPEQTSTAQKKYQKSILEKSLESIDQVYRSQRDHTSTTMAIAVEDLPRAKQEIERFRKELTALLEDSKTKPNQVYQLQVSFFPLTQLP